MLLTVANVLDGGTVAEIQADLPALTWREGAETAGRVAGAVKQNKQADLTSRVGARLRDRLSAAIEAHPVIRAAAQPKRFSKLIVSLTTPGGGYGTHIDNPFMGHGAERMRADLSFTLFLSAPERYDGGALTIEHAGMSQSVKLPAGDLVLYPSTRLHRVEPVISGDRYVCVGWIESHVADAGDREILFDLETLQASLADRFDPQSPERLTLAKTIANLLRRFN